MPKIQVVQIPLGLYQALLNKIAERPYGEVAQLMGAAQAQAKVLDAPEAPAADAPAKPGKEKK